MIKIKLNTNSIDIELIKIILSYYKNNIHQNRIHINKIHKCSITLLIKSISDHWIFKSKLPNVKNTYITINI